jgi:FG-GAP-like repeat
VCKGGDLHLRTMKAKIRFTSWPPLVSVASVVVGVISAQAAPTKIVTGPDTGVPPQVNTYSPAGTSTGSFLADNPNFTGGVRVATGDVFGGNDIITGAGPGGGPRVNVYRGPAHTIVYSFFAFAANFNLGVFVAGGDVNGDGRADIIVGAGDGTGSAPQVKVFSGADGTTVLASFYAFSPSFTGGVRVAAGDVNGGGRVDIIAGAGPGSGQITVFSGNDLGVLRTFLPFGNFTGGVYVAAGDVNGDGFDDIIVGAGTGAARVAVFSGADGSVLKDFLAFPNATGGVRVAGTDLNGDGRADIIAATGPGDSSRVKGFDGTTLSILADFVPYGTSTAGVFPGAIPRFPAQSLNISTRLNVLNGDNVLIGGFIIAGNDPKNVIIRGIGPSSGLPGALADPTLELFSGNTRLATNNNWKDTQQAAIEQTGIPPGNDFESAIVQLLPPGSYTAILRGNAGGTGIGLVEAYDLNHATTDSQLANISTRGFVQTGNNVMIAGLILSGGTGTNKVYIRALGPSLSQSGIPNPLPDPTLGLYDSQGTLLRGNDDWRQNQEAEIQATGIPPTNNLESALIAILRPGNYTAIVGGFNEATGVGLVEAYNLQ